MSPILRALMAGRSRVCGSSAAGWTTSFAKSPRCRPDPRPSLPPPDNDAQYLDHFSPRARELFRHSARLCVHRDFFGHGGGVELLPRLFLRARAGRPAILFYVSSVALPRPDPGVVDAAVGRRAQERHDRAVSYAADTHDRGGHWKIPRRLVLCRDRARLDLPVLDHGQSPRATR